MRCRQRWTCGTLRGLLRLWWSVSRRSWARGCLYSTTASRWCRTLPSWLLDCWQLLLACGCWQRVVSRWGWPVKLCGVCRPSTYLRRATGSTPWATAVLCSCSLLARRQPLVGSTCRPTPWLTCLYCAGGLTGFRSPWSSLQPEYAPWELVDSL